MNIEDICPVSDSLDFFSRKWVLYILMDMFRGKKHFTDFQESNPELSNHVLSQTLKYMEEVGLITKETVDEKTRNKTYYKLSDKGLKTNKILYELSVYSLNELECSKLNENVKKEILENYTDSLSLND
ncbi:MAG: helix-turn-helix transcriptional regulator [Methanobrevibacter sp.]|uniref:winged helix-turn-helix transcriptional regulator n=1 Tax=Methanobrevibacter sp. TaxID=66852 RepID=UPI001B49A1A9|nr:helix-turn-helix domain-containing protein [Methanobrevibacter sp.]MBP3790735.1 helix-turn-helix transcriptional regulator [Methanobrevibacter sp.]